MFPPASGPRWLFILSAVCQVRVMTSPMRPMAWESELIMLMAPRSCRMSSAAMVSPRMRLSANATSSGRFGVEMMADHQHVEMLVKGIDGVRAGGVGGTGQDVWLAANADNVRRMAAARAFASGRCEWSGP